MKQVKEMSADTISSIRISFQIGETQNIVNGQKNMNGKKKDVKKVYQ